MAGLDPREVDQFLNAASIKLPGSSIAGIKAELFDTLKEFFEDSNSWTEDIPFQAEADNQDYVLVPRYDGQIIRLTGVWDDKGIPIPTFMAKFGTIKLVNAPNTTPTSEWTARVVKTVTLPITKDAMPVGPDWTLRVYSVHILDGLLGRMMGQQSKPFSNSIMSAYHLKRFRTGIQLARTAAIRMNGVGNQEWAYPRGGKGSQRGGVSTAWPSRAF